MSLRLAILSGLCSIVSASVALGSDWPAGPADRPDYHRRLVTAVTPVEVRLAPPSCGSRLHGRQSRRRVTHLPRCRRLIVPRPAQVHHFETPPEGIGMYHIILWSSLGIVRSYAASERQPQPAALQPASLGAGLSVGARRVVCRARPTHYRRAVPMRHACAATEGNRPERTHARRRRRSARLRLCSVRPSSPPPPASPLRR